jgi:hypothetical protein
MAVLAVLLLFALVPVTAVGQTNCGGNCHECAPDRTHLYEDPEGGFWPYTYDCAEAPCPNGCKNESPGGEDEEEEEAELLEAVAAGDMARVATLMRARDYVRFNVQRGAVQVIARLECGADPGNTLEVVVLHVPLRPALALALNEELTRAVTKLAGAQFGGDLR